MITVLTGENSFFVERRLAEIVGAFDGDVERVDGESVLPEQLPELLSGMTLLSDHRLVVIRRLAENTAAFTALEPYIEQSDDAIHIVLVEPKLDKRTRTYKQLKQHAAIEQFTPWTDRDTATATTFARAEADRLGLDLTAAAARQVVQRTGNDPWRVFRAVEVLALAGDTSEQTIDALVALEPGENVFRLFETALRGDAEQVHQLIDTFEMTEDPYQVLGLLVSQAFHLSALAASSGQPVAKDFGVHPYVLEKLRPYAASRGSAGARRIVRELARADDRIKTSATNPWLVIEQALIASA